MNTDNAQRCVAPPYFAFLALRMKMYVPLGPGTDPRTSSRFSSVSTFTTFKFFAVTLTFPMCPGKCWFFQTREGKELPPIDRKSTRLNSSHITISYAVFCLKKKKKKKKKN